MNLLKFLMPKTVASVCDLDKVVAKLQAVADEQENHAVKLGVVVCDLNQKRDEAYDEAAKARKIITGINNLLGL